MAKGTWYGSTRKDSPILSMPVFISSVHRLSELARPTQTPKENTSGEKPQTSSQEKTNRKDNQ